MDMAIEIVVATPALLSEIEVWLRAEDDAYQKASGDYGDSALYSSSGSLFGLRPRRAGARVLPLRRSRAAINAASKLR
jgi:hypothetical protein